MEVDAIGSGRWHTKDAVEEIEGHHNLALPGHQNVAILILGVDVFLPPPSISVGSGKI
jgi:hypothetical protein